MTTSVSISERAARRIREILRKEGDGAIIELDGPAPHRVPVSRAKIAEVKARLGLAHRTV